MNLFLLYCIMLKATLTSFNGPSSLPILRDDLVVHRHVLTDRELNAAVVAGRCSPGPMGIYVVSVGYFVDGVPGAFAGFLAMITPAFLIIPLLRYVGHRAEDPRIRGTLNAAVVASVGLILCSAVPLAKDAITGWFPFVISLVSVAILAFTRIETIWIIVGSVAAGAIGKLIL